MENKMFNHKKFRNILLVVWGLLFCFNLAFALWTPSAVGWVCVGFIAGGIFVMFLDNQSLSIQDDFIQFLMKINRAYSNRVNDIYNAIEKYDAIEKKYDEIKLKKKKSKRKELKGGKK